MVAEGVTEDAPEILPADRLGIEVLFLSTNPIGDLSNCIKTLEDALNRRAYKDDKQIDYIKALRVYEPNLDSRILLRVKERDNAIST